MIVWGGWWRVSIGDTVCGMYQWILCVELFGVGKFRKRKRYMRFVEIKGKIS